MCYARSDGVWAPSSGAETSWRNCPNVTTAALEDTAADDSELKLYVSVNGSDDAVGSASLPLRTLHRARDLS